MQAAQPLVHSHREWWGLCALGAVKVALPAETMRHQHERERKKHTHSMQVFPNVLFDNVAGFTVLHGLGFEPWDLQWYLGGLGHHCDFVFVARNKEVVGRAMPTASWI